jgi:hypothetical protein
VKRETAEGLALFRQQQEEADKKAQRGSDGAAIDEGLPTLEEEVWVAGGRKRKRAKEKEGLKGVKIRRSSTSIETAKLGQASTPGSSSPNEGNFQRTEAATVQPQKIQELQDPKAESPAINKKPLPRPKAGLVDYGSDEEDDW